MSQDLSSATFRGYRRENGRVGVRNHVIILPVDDLSNAACEAVANNIPDAMALPHRTAPFPNLSAAVTLPERPDPGEAGGEAGDGRRRRRRRTG